MKSSEEIEAVLADRREKAAELERKAEEAAKLEADLSDLQKDLQRFLDRHRRFSAYGDGHIEIPHSVQVPNLGVIEFHALKSKLNGKQLAKKIEPQIAHLREQIARREAAIQELVSDAA